MIRTIQGSAHDIPIPDGSVHCIVTSPPYYGLRKYSGDQDVDWPEVEYAPMPGMPPITVPTMTAALGLEPTLEAYIGHLVLCLREWWRVLRDDGAVWCNIGDSYMGSTTGGGSGINSTLSGTHHRQREPDSVGKRGAPNLKRKDLMLVPYRLALAAQADGWWVRSAIVWAKGVSFCPTYAGSCMPECLDPDTETLVKDEDTIKPVSLDWIWENKHRLDDLRIATPSGWGRILDVWETRKPAMELQVASWGTVYCSPEHRFPASHDRRRMAIHDIPVKDIRTEGYKDYLLWCPLSEVLDTPTLSTVNLLEIPNDNLQVLLSPKHRKIYRSRMIDIHGSLKEWSVYHGCAVKESGRSQYSALLQGLRSGRVPLSVYREGGDVAQTDGIRVVALHEKRDKSLPASVALDYDMGYFIGLYVAEGGRDVGRGWRIKWTFHRDETELISFVEKIVQELGLTPSLADDRSVTYVRAAGCALWELIGLFVDGTCTDKRLHLSQVLATPQLFRQGLWDGYLAGDGHISEKNTITATSASEQLIHDFRYVVSSIGYVPGEYTYEQYDARTAETYRSWSIRLPYHEHRQDKAGTAFKQIKPTAKRETGRVSRMIDLSVEGEVFLLKDGLITHNSARDRPTQSYEMVYLLAKSERYFYDVDAVREPLREPDAADGSRVFGGANKHGANLEHGERTNGRRYENAPGGRQLRSVWTINPEGYPDAHYAVFPQALVSPIIQLATSARGCCPACGAPWERVVERERRPGSSPVRHDMTSRRYDGNGDRNDSGDERYHTISQTTGWQPTCNCDAGEPVPCTVCDPFVGSGTTLAVAMRHGRHAIGVDISQEYLDEHVPKRTANVQMEMPL